MRSKSMILTEKDMNHGDHIYVKRKGLFYSHHGIYAGERTVIHYKGAEKEKKRSGSQKNGYG